MDSRRLSSLMSLRSAREKTERVSDAGRGSECSEESVNEAIRDCRMTLTPLRATPLAAQCVITAVKTL